MKFKFWLSVLVGVFLISISFAAEYSLTETSKLSVGDIIIGPDGDEILIESIEVLGVSSQDYLQMVGSEKGNSLMDIIRGKLGGRSLPESVVSGGSSSEGLSMGVYGTGVLVEQGTKIDLVEIKEEKKSFWNKLFFWRGK